MHPHGASNRLKELYKIEIYYDFLCLDLVPQIIIVNIIISHKFYGLP